MGQQYPITPRSTNPTFAAAPSSPARNGREAFGHASDTSATAFGHTPPTPRHARNRSASIASAESAK